MHWIVPIYAQCVFDHADKLNPAIKNGSFALYR